jgi:hypothetical protein
VRHQRRLVLQMRSIRALIPDRSWNWARNVIPYEARHRAARGRWTDTGARMSAWWASTSPRYDHVIWKVSNGD